MKKKQRQNLKGQRRAASSDEFAAQAQPTEQTLMDHIKELQTRLFITAAFFLLIAAAAFPFFEQIVDIIIKPLGDQHELVYLTPSGAFNFMILVSIYVGIIGALPVIIFHVYRFLMPAVKATSLRRAITYTVTSLLLAIAGIVFAYLVMLPAAIQFLTGFDFYHINPMLTIDSYFSFVMTYIVVGAALFQLPLIMFIINTATPLDPGDLMKHQGKIIVGSFIVAALVSPTPDALNQALLASPIVVMYQVGIILIWLNNRRDKKRQTQQLLVKTAKVKAAQPIVAEPVRQPVPVAPAPLVPSPPVQVVQSRSQLQSQPISSSVSPGRQRPTVDGFYRSGQQLRSRPRPVVRKSVATRPRPIHAVRQLPMTPHQLVTPPMHPVNYPRSINGFI